MDSLQNKLKATQRKRASDAVWAANDAAQFVLNEFRKQVQAGPLPVSEGTDPYYTFKVSELAAQPTQPSRPLIGADRRTTCWASWPAPLA